MVAKRANGEGSKSRHKSRQRKDGRWEARYTDRCGKRRTVYAKTRKEVAAKLVDAMANQSDEQQDVRRVRDRVGLALGLTRFHGSIRVK